MKIERGKCRNGEGKCQDFEAVPWEWGCLQENSKETAWEALKVMLRVCGQMEKGGIRPVWGAGERQKQLGDSRDLARIQLENPAWDWDPSAQKCGQKGFLKEQNS